MRVSIIAAMDNNRVIGKDNGLPWHLPEDMTNFKRRTFGKPVIMGRKTFESIGGPLLGRTNIVLTRQPWPVEDGVRFSLDMEKALSFARSLSDEVMIVGGAQVYEQALEFADRMYLTEIDGEYEGDTWFPKFDRDEWQEKLCLESPHDCVSPPYNFLILDRKKDGTVS